jgi:LysM repeat protein
MSRAVAAALLLTLAGASAPRPTACEDGYRVVRGDTLYSIARRCGTSVAAIARASGIRNPHRIEVGQRLVIPGARRTAVAARPEGPLVYHMARGDTLYSLARWSGTRLPALLAANPGIDPHKIEIGDPIRLPAGAVSPERARARERGSAATPRPAAAPQPRSSAPAPAPASEPEPRRERQQPEPEPMAM